MFKSKQCWLDINPTFNFLKNLENCAVTDRSHICQRPIDFLYNIISLFEAGWYLLKGELQSSPIIIKSTCISMTTDDWVYLTKVRRLTEWRRWADWVTSVDLQRHSSVSAERWYSRLVERQPSASTTGQTNTAHQLTRYKYFLVTRITYGEIPHM